MSIDLLHFAPLPALAGGLLIGVAAALLVLVNGRIAGISGIAGGLLDAASRDRAWRALFVLGLVAAPWAFRLVAPLPAVTIAASPAVLVVAGLLVGIGTRYASGCTSGHGVCGISRGSVRSLAATAAFMAVGFCVVFITRHLLGL
ncbi:YeeE/YedE family protein [Trinickia terrae]|uniref:YeeE/YedE family protein n=1 Tax=Trinickia terrae TaxID=2571161 RepID=A0A4U1I3Q4_9BURK|nr:YeeE/YedE family protein [Trinickia terrae]TKC87883.1 YeeE/YedE family protein [Trinickia terrae]